MREDERPMHLSIGEPTGAPPPNPWRMAAEMDAADAAEITDAEADALGAVLSEGMDPAYLARVGDFSDEQIAAGELRAADAEAERLNRDLYRRAIAAALEVRARGANQSRDWTEVRLSGQPPHGFPFYDFTFCSDHENWTALPQIWERAQGWTDVKVVTRRVHVEATEWEPWSP